MSNNYYSFEPFPKLQFDKNRIRVKICPCGKNNKDGKFIPYVGFDCKGYCHSCDESFLPELNGSEKGSAPKAMHKAKIKDTMARKVDFIPFSLYRKQLIQEAHLYSQNHFIQWLGDKSRGNSAFAKATIKLLIEKYFLGNSNLQKYQGWMLFPYIDINGRLCDIKAMDYNPTTGKRIKEPFNKIAFIGKEFLKNPNANTVRCFYGEHLLNANQCPVKIFESEATATYAAAFFPDSICLATGGTNGCKWTDEEKCKVLQGHRVTLYPDIDAHDKWEQKAKILRDYGLNVEVSSLIKQQALHFAEHYGFDYAELVNQKFDLRDVLKFKQLNNYIKQFSLHSINEPIVALKEINTNPRFQNMTLAQVQTKSGLQYSFLFDSAGEGIEEPTPLVEALAAYYELTFSLAIFNGDYYLAAVGHSKRI